MAITVKKAVLWRTEVDNTPGTLAGVLKPFAEAKADLHVVMGYRYPGNEEKAAIEVFPVTGKKIAAAAEAAGLKAAGIPSLIVEGDNEPGLGYSIAEALAGASINLAFLMGQVIEDRYSAILGFETEEDSVKAAPLIKKAVSRRASAARSGR